MSDEALRRRYRELFEIAPNAYLTTDTHGVIEEANRAAERLLGRDRGLLTGTSFATFVTESHRPAFQARLEALRSGRAERIQDWQLSLCSGDGECLGVDECLDVEATVELVRASFAGGASGLVWLLRDVTERKKAEERLRDRELRLRKKKKELRRALRHAEAILEERAAMEEALRRERDFAESLVDTAPAIVLVLDTEGRIVRFNRYMEEISGYRLDEVVGRDWFSTFLPPGDRVRVGDVFERLLHGQTASATNPILTKGGAELMVEWHNTLLKDAEGETAWVLAIGQDITDRLRLEEQFRQAQKMEAVGRLAGGVAHDFNTLLGSIIGYSELLLESLPEGERLHLAAAQIHRGAERGADLTRRLLAFSRHHVFAPRVLDLGAVIDEMDDMLRRLLGEDVELVLEKEPGLGSVRADPGQIEQAVMNLVVNSRDAMPHGGRLRLETRNVDLDESAAREAGVPKPGPHVLLEVSDTGCGMDEETRNHAFEPFFTTKEIGKGTGLGLSTVYGMVTRNQGSITVESDPGRGATFRIYLPRVAGRPVSRAPLPKKTAEPSRGSETVLLVEDDDMFRDLLSEVLESNGYHVLAAREPAEALELSDGLERPVELVVSDMVMPGMTGNQLARCLRERHRGIRVLLMSGYTDEDLEERGASGRGESFLQKPFSTRDFLATVREVLSS